jgi:modulator of FtsH protease HflC
VIIAEAQREAQIIRGEGDGNAVRIFAEAFGKDVDFFTFYRSMQAYRDALGDQNTSVVLSPNSEFFRYFGPRPELPSVETAATPAPTDFTHQSGPSDQSQQSGGLGATENVPAARGAPEETELVRQRDGGQADTALE